MPPHNLGGKEQKAENMRRLWNPGYEAEGCVGAQE